MQYNTHISRSYAHLSHTYVQVFTSTTVNTVLNKVYLAVPLKKTEELRHSRYKVVISGVYATM